MQSLLQAVLREDEAPVTVKSNDNLNSGQPRSVSPQQAVSIHFRAMISPLVASFSGRLFLYGGKKATRHPIEVSIVTLIGQIWVPLCSLSQSLWPGEETTLIGQHFSYSELWQ